MRALVTGCAGFIGSHLSERLLAEGHDVIGIDCMTDYYDVSQKTANIEAAAAHPHFTFCEVDLLKADLRPILDGVDLIFHEAAQPGVRASWGSFFETYVRNNVMATQRLLEAAKSTPLTKFVYASSSSVYGDAEAFPTSEAALPRPVSPYGVTKLAGEQLVYLYWRNYGLPTVSLRYFTVYGPRQRPDMAFHRFIKSGLAGKTIQIFGDGEQTRDFTFVSDIVAANLAAATSDVAGEVFNIGGGSRVSVNQVLSLIRDLIGPNLSVQYVDKQRGDVRHTSADTTHARMLLGYEPYMSLQTGIAAEVNWLQTASTRSGLQTVPAH